MSYQECVGMTGDWYRQVVRDGVEARALTLAQIADYEDRAAARDLGWR